MAPAGCRRGGRAGSGRVPGGMGVGSGRVAGEGLAPAGCSGRVLGGRGWLRQGAAGMGVGSGRVPGEGLAPAGCRGGGVGSGRVPRVWGLAPAGCRGRGWLRQGAGGMWVGSGRVLIRQGAGVSSGMMLGDGVGSGRLPGGRGGRVARWFMYIQHFSCVFIYIYIYLILNINIYIYSFIILI